MRYSLAPVALAALVAGAPQGVTQAISPSGATPEGCMTSYTGTFNIQIVDTSSVPGKRDLEKRQEQVLTLTLQNGKLMDQNGRTGYIASNNQFQFDKPPQAGAIYTAGWSVCPNQFTDRLTLGSMDTFYSCLSGSFYNLYDKSIGGQCKPIYINVVRDGSAGAASVQPDGQPTGPVNQINDGQIQATSAVNVATVLSDGQPEAPTAVAPVTQINDGQIQATSAVNVATVLSDGQPEVNAPVTQISDGQIQATQAVNPVTQIGDGQIQAPTVTQIGDGQIQAPTGGMVMNATSSYMPVQTGNSASALQLSSGMGLLAALFGIAAL